MLIVTLVTRDITTHNTLFWRFYPFVKMLNLNIYTPYYQAITIFI